MVGYLSLILAPHFITWIVLFWLYRSRKLSGTGKLINGIIAILWVTFAFQITPWGLTCYYFRYLYPALLLLILFILIRKRSSQSASDVLYRFRFNRYVRLIVIGGLAVLNFLALLSGYYPADEAMDLQIPFRFGTYYVMQGGNSPITNYFHRSHNSQSYALDITKLNVWGNRATGVFPKNPNQYAIYGDTVLSPVSGTTIFVVDGLPDQIPPNRDKKNPLGNHVRIESDGRLIILAHFQPGSLMVKTGESVEVGQPIARVGNSGNSMEPHLHIQVSDLDLTTHKPTWKPVPFRLDGKFYDINDLIRPK